MARVKNGANGQVSGKVGSVVFYNWKDNQYVRSQPTVNKKRKKSEGEINNRNKFGFLQTFLSPYITIIRLGFHSQTNKMSAFNAAMSYNLHHAVLQDEGGTSIDYPRLAISRGLDNPISAAELEIVENRLTIKWELENEDTLRDKKQTGFRTLALLIPEADLTKAEAVILGNYIRDKHESIPLPYLQNESICHVYLGFAAIDGSERSTNSVYLGAVFCPGKG